ncbi:MAG: hypothetical protein LBE98_04075 [Puniceicoccales bacterium]|jgi:hypothetical protein|nr:hypothetical protein [Puniceicoccales bacterium]
MRTNVKIELYALRMMFLTDKHRNKTPLHAIWLTKMELATEKFRTLISFWFPDLIRLRDFIKQDRTILLPFVTSEHAQSTGHITPTFVTCKETAKANFNKWAVWEIILRNCLQKFDTADTSAVLACLNFLTIFPTFLLAALYIWTILAAKKVATFIAYWKIILRNCLQKFDTADTSIVLACLNFLTIFPTFLLAALCIWTILAAKKVVTFVAYWKIVLKNCLQKFDTADTSVVLACLNFLTILPTFLLAALYIWTILAAKKVATFIAYLDITFGALIIFEGLVAKAFLVKLLATVENFRTFFDKFLCKLGLAFCKRLFFFEELFMSINGEVILWINYSTLMGTRSQIFAA